MDDNHQGVRSSRKAGLIVASALAVLFVIGIIGSTTDGSDEGARSAGESPSAFAGEPKRLQGDQYTALVAEGATPATLSAAAAAFCNGKEWCQVMAWRDEANRPKVMPMVARESDSIAFNYLINRSTNTENSMWDCRIWNGPPEVCLEPDKDDSLPE